MKIIAIIIMSITLFVVQQPSHEWVPSQPGVVAQMLSDDNRYIAHDYLAGAYFDDTDWMTVVSDSGSQAYRVIGRYYCLKVSDYYAACPWDAMAPLGENLPQFDGLLTLMTCAPSGWWVIVAAPVQMTLREELINYPLQLFQHLHPPPWQRIR